MSKYTAICGVEIECALRNDTEMSSYHDSYGDEGTRWLYGESEYFYCESDSSVESFQDFNEVECISTPFVLKDWEIVVTDFINTVQSVNESSFYPELSEQIELNETMGCHIHFNIVRKDESADYEVSHRIGVSRYPKVKHSIMQYFLDHETLLYFRQLLHYRVRTALPHVYPKWSGQYFRSYAQSLENANFNESVRSCEWNLTRRNRTLEFRSMNLNGCQSWDDVEALFRIVFDTFQEVLDMCSVQKELFEDGFEAVLEITESDAHQSYSYEANLSNSSERMIVLEQHLPTYRSRTYTERVRRTIEQ